MNDVLRYLLGLITCLRLYPTVDERAAAVVDPRLPSLRDQARQRNSAATPDQRQQGVYTG